VHEGSDRNAGAKGKDEALTSQPSPTLALYSTRQGMGRGRFRTSRVSSEHPVAQEGRRAVRKTTAVTEIMMRAAQAGLHLAIGRSSCPRGFGGAPAGCLPATEQTAETLREY